MRDSEWLQIAEALEAAHAQGIIHRDLTPVNIRMRPDGSVKVLDFGLAKVMEPNGGVSSAKVSLNSPTITSPAMTMQGVVLGTAGYISPEQAQGKSADKRSDIWAFGCVLYEMLTGKAAFVADDVSDTLANVLKREPDWRLLPQDVSPSIRRCLQGCLAKDQGCLAKDPRARLPHIAVAQFFLNERPDDVLRRQPSQCVAGRP